MDAIKISNLTKDYKWFKAIENVNINIKKGSVYWFIWANGAWKSTTLKILSGLIRKTNWEVEVLGKEWTVDTLKNIGSIIEYPSLYEKNTGYENLLMHAYLTWTKKEKIKEILNIVWLNEIAAKRQTGKYSLWMKQRLAIWIALLNDPEILILDEPTNGLDVEWIKEIRELLIKLGKLWKTVIISSHQLSEIEKACTHIWVIKKWQMKFDWTKDEFMSRWKDWESIEEIYLNLVS